MHCRKSKRGPTKTLPMDKKQIAKLAEISYIDNKLNADRVEKIISHLDKGELREYLKALRKQEQKLVVYIDYALELSEDNKKKFENLYPDKIVIFRNNPDLVMGIRITEDDMVYNFNMDNALGQIREYLDKSI